MLLITSPSGWRGSETETLLNDLHIETLHIETQDGSTTRCRRHYQLKPCFNLKILVGSIVDLYRKNRLKFRTMES